MAFYSPEHKHRQNNSNNRNNRSKNIEMRSSRKKFPDHNKKGKWKIKYLTDKLASRNSSKNIYISRIILIILIFQW